MTASNVWGRRSGLFCSSVFPAGLTNLFTAAIGRLSCGICPRRRLVCWTWAAVTAGCLWKSSSDFPRCSFRGSIYVPSSAKNSNGAYDTVVSFSVLEHLPQPQQALREMCRVCRPGGTVVVDVPHLSRYHELPHDYYRFTEHGLSHLAEAAGLEVVEVQPLGGLAAFLGHQVSTVLVCSFWRIPVLKWGVFAANYLLVVCPTIWLDRLLKTVDVFPSSLVGVFRRPLD